VAALKRAGRLAWVDEECAALAAQPVAERVEDPHAFARLKGARELPPRGLAVARELYALRERLARAHDRPPFKILSEETLVRLAGAAPGDREALAQVSGCTPKVIARWGDAILEAVARALVRPADELPRIEPRPRPRIAAAAVARLADLGEPADVIEIFRRPAYLPDHAREILVLPWRPTAVWFQLGIRHDGAAAMLARAGIRVVQDRCMMPEHRRLLGVQ